ncbi:hypothetical protein [Mycetocola zhujimingii]|uniref:Uncharacterized protein n=1 Tax=Mycetocola zhujimingii TaxID=2079792 RepID=A0A2U1TG56_9MICO|nr:hypothetical protein [Mycetocola zhujimingii]PWC07800.1 hypothetical protein DF223_00045 [Mycetocola zhujimingii]
MQLVSLSRGEHHRTLVQAQLVSLGFILAGIVLGWSTLDFSRPAAWLLIPGLCGSLLVYAGVYRLCETRVRPAGG